MSSANDPKSYITHFLKNSDYRTIFATGFIGGPTPNGLINIHVLTDRNPIPRSITMDMTQNPPKETDKDTKVGMIREVPVGLLLDINTAISLKEWLEKQISTITEIQKTLNTEK